MSRLVKKVNLPIYGEIYVACAEDASIESIRALQEPLKKLYEYEQEEESGTLAHLPCKVGNTVYSVSFKKKCPETNENGGYLINQNIDCAFCDNENCKSKEEWFIEEITATLPMIANIILEKDKDSDDFMIYLIREEAEKKLKEMEE